MRSFLTSKPLLFCYFQQFLLPHYIHLTLVPSLLFFTNCHCLFLHFTCFRISPEGYSLCFEFFFSFSVSCLNRFYIFPLTLLYWLQYIVLFFPIYCYRKINYLSPIFTSTKLLFYLENTFLLFDMNVFIMSMSVAGWYW